MNTLRPYQEDFVSACAKSLAKGNKAIIAQAPTGSGKTVCLSTIAARFNKKSGQKVLILVHRIELLTQTIKTLYNWYGLRAQDITADTKHVFDADIYVGMCETVFRRLTSNPRYLPEIGLLIIDEAHSGQYFKIHDLFPNPYIIGFSATPLSSNKLKPLKNYFQDIICGPEIVELIDSGSLCQNLTYRFENDINRKKLKVRHGEFDEKAMGDEFIKSKNIINTIQAYSLKAEGKKAIVFNCNIEHSERVTEAFIKAGYPCKHLDGQSKDREEIFDWLKETPGAILCNVGVATTGFDEPSIECVIMNRATMSMPLWLQCTGRASRPFANKPNFIIIDLGGNATTHGDWSDGRNWEYIFHYPPIKGEGVAPVKDCPKCDALVHASALECKICGYKFKRDEIPDDAKPLKLILHDSVEAVINETSNSKEYHSFFLLGKHISKTLKKHPARAIEMYQESIQEWCKLKGKRYNQFHKDLALNHIKKELGL